VKNPRAGLQGCRAADQAGAGGAADGGQDPVQAEVPGLLDVAANQERSRELHRDEPVGQATIVRAADSACRGPAISVTTRRNVRGAAVGFSHRLATGCWATAWLTPGLPR